MLYQSPMKQSLTISFLPTVCAFYLTFVPYPYSLFSVACFFFTIVKISRDVPLLARRNRFHSESVVCVTEWGQQHRSVEKPGCAVRGCEVVGGSMS